MSVKQVNIHLLHITQFVHVGNFEEVRTIVKAKKRLHGVAELFIPFDTNFESYINIKVFNLDITENKKWFLAGGKKNHPSRMKETLEKIRNVMIFLVGVIAVFVIMSNEEDTVTGVIPGIKSNCFILYYINII